MMARWGKLPPELRLMVFEEVVLDYEHKRQPYAYSVYASVEREWQLFFEGENFRRLTLRPSCLGRFDEIVRGRKRRRLDDIRRLSLLVELEEYDCSVCNSAHQDTSSPR